MKKTLLTLAIAGLATFSYAQRSVDWSTETIVTPDSLKSTSAGTAINLEVIMKNNGTDTVWAGDSIWYQFAGNIGTSQVFLYPGPNGNTFQIKLITRTVPPGDTVHLVLNTSAPIKVNSSVNLDFVFIAHVLNRPSLNFEGSAGLTNNKKTRTIIWWNEHGWAVGIDPNDPNSTTKVYPNPVKDVLHIEVSNDQVKVLDIFDITGKKVESISFSDTKTEVNVAAYTRGIYMYEIKTSEGQLIKAGKLSVN